MSDDIEIIRAGIRRFRTGGIAVAALPLVLGFALILGSSRERGLEMIVSALILLFLVFWLINCAEDVVNKLQAARRDRG